MNSNITVAFFIETTFHYYVYESVINELVSMGVKCHLVLNDILGQEPEWSIMHKDAASFIENLDRDDVSAFTISQITSENFLYDCMISVYYSHLIAECAKKHIRILYGVAKDTWNYAWWNIFFHKILCYGVTDYRKLNIYDSCEIIGNPRFDPWFNDAIPKYIDTINELVLDAKKPTILYAPTYGGLSSIDKWIHFLNELQEDYNVIVKLHHCTALRNSEHQRRNYLNSNFKNIISDPAKNLALLKICDYLITDNSGMIFEGVLAEKKIILLNSDDNSMLSSEENNDVKVREKLINVNDFNDLKIALSSTSIFNNQNQILKEIITETYSFNDGKCGRRAADAILKEIASTKSENTFHASLRTAIFG